MSSAVSQRYTSVENGWRYQAGGVGNHQECEVCSMTAYRIKNWNESFEKAQGRRCAKMTWVALPNRHDGKGYRRVAKHERATELFTAWVLIVEVASKMPTRGVLIDEDGPLTAEDLADMTGFSAAIFHLAFTVLTQPNIGWIERVAGSALIADSECAHSCYELQDRTQQDI
jgi:hypothetical protein